mmetsp:Transcript_84376/g.239744  ORF Transcript_84376/g.239744 Transcript_84376/m.239744 type:complete len:216 (+) Transcript_84376:743-1390(+)
MSLARLCRRSRPSNRDGQPQAHGRSHGPYGAPEETRKRPHGGAPCGQRMELKRWGGGHTRTSHRSCVRSRRPSQARRPFVRGSGVWPVCCRVPGPLVAVPAPGTQQTSRTSRSRWPRQVAGGFVLCPNAGAHAKPGASRVALRPGVGGGELHVPSSVESAPAFLESGRRLTAQIHLRLFVVRVSSPLAHFPMPPHPAARHVGGAPCPCGPPNSRN